MYSSSRERLWEGVFRGPVEGVALNRFRSLAEHKNVCSMREDSI